MRWNDLQNHPKDRAERVKTWFAFSPVKINNEIRWLEKVTIKQLYIFKIVGVSQWINVEFL